MSFQIGPNAKRELSEMAMRWNQGEHILVTGGTGSGKTLLARQLDEIRIRRGGYVVVFVCKVLPDETLLKNYSTRDGWVRWKKWKKRPAAGEKKILLWPDLKGKNQREVLSIQKRVFGDAMDAIFKTGKWTVHVDEGLYFTDPQFLGFRAELGMLSSLIRSGKGTLITLAQRPAHLPVALYPNLSHAFVGQASELPDLKRLADMDGRENSRVLQQRISGLGRHDFLHISVGSDHPATVVNLAE